ncbi:hypothetical protein OG548_14280 [Streptomyces sp. NBC_01356]|uniref:hypothetical protein n=1 Tax=Streptomyces sp. NBC_01356 TaxID=2903836 RepID=UPI002E343F49|nr:hypothetical protein [Streptomyces sp. NBC_01356]
MSAVDHHAEAHRLKGELGYGARRIATELGITRYAAVRLLERPVAEPVAEVVGQERPVAEPLVDQAAEVADEVADGALVGPLLVIDLGRFPGLAEDLALLQGARATAEGVVNFAVDRLATTYRTALARGLLVDGQAFDVVEMRLKPGTRTRPAAVR